MNAPTGLAANAVPLWRDPALLLAAALWLGRAAYARFPDLFPEEAYYWSYAKHLDYGYLDHPPVVAWLIALGTRLFGDTGFGVRVFALLASLATSFFAFRLAALLYGRRAAAVAVLAVQVLPFFFLSGIVMTPDAPLTACWSAMLFFLARALLERSIWAWLGVGLALGFGMLSKYTIALLGPATLLFLALDPDSRFWFRHAAPYLAVALSVVIFSPVVVWNATHHWASFAFQTTERTRVRRHFALHELLGTILCVLTPAGAWLAVHGISTPPATPFLLSEDLSRRRRLFTRVFTLVPLAVFVVFSLTHRVKLNWTGPLWLAVIPALAAFLTSPAVASPLRRSDRWLRPAWLVTVAVCTVAYALVLQHIAFGLPGIKYSRNIELLPVGWSDLAQDVERQQTTLEHATNGPVYVVGMDRNFIASEVCFYQSDTVKSLRQTTGSHLFQGGSLMYGYWSPPAQFQGATLLLVGFNKSELTPTRLASRCRSADPLQTHVLSHAGKSIRPYYTQVVYGYQSIASAASP